MELHLQSSTYIHDVKTEFQGHGTNPKRTEYRLRFFVSVYSRHYLTIPISGRGEFQRRPQILNFCIIRLHRISIKSLTTAPCKLGWRVSGGRGGGGCKIGPLTLGTTCNPMVSSTLSPLYRRYQCDSETGESWNRTERRAVKTLPIGNFNQSRSANTTIWDLYATKHI